jgi:hypothetical protein
MPWEAEADGIRFSGPLVDLMSLIMTAYEEETAASKVDVVPGVWVTASAIVLREILLEVPADEISAPLIERVSDAMQEDEDGVVTIDAFAMLDDVADHVELVPLSRWLSDPAIRDAIADVTNSALSE